MTRDPQLKASRLAKRSSFWNTSPQDGQEKSPRNSKRSSNVVVPLFDQLTSLKDWKEETAELCSAEEGRAKSTSLSSVQSNGRRNATSGSRDGIQAAQEAQPAASAWTLSASKQSRRTESSQDVLPRKKISEDSAMPLTRNPGVHVLPEHAHDWRQHMGTLATHFKDTSIESDRNKPSRSFSRSDFTFARPYEARQQRPRRRTFIMADLHPTSSSNIALVENDNATSFADDTGSLWTVGDSVLKSILGSALYRSTAGVCCG